MLKPSSARFYLIKLIMKTIIVTQKELYDAMKPSIQRNKKKYTRKKKHKNRLL